MIISRHPDYAAVIDNELTIIASRESLMVMDSIISSRCGYGSIFDEVAQENYRIRLMPIAAYERINYSGYAVRAYPANHGTPDQGFMIYSIAQGGKSVLYATILLKYSKKSGIRCASTTSVLTLSSLTIHTGLEWSPAITWQ